MSEITDVWIDEYAEVSDEAFERLLKCEKPPSGARITTFQKDTGPDWVKWLNNHYKVLRDDNPSRI